MMYNSLNKIVLHRNNLHYNFHLIKADALLAGKHSLLINIFFDQKKFKLLNLLKV